MPVSPRTGLALVTLGHNDPARYELAGLLLLEPEAVVPSDATHVAFYTNGAIQPQVPGIVARYPTLVLSRDTVHDLKSSGEVNERRAAEAIEVLLRLSSLAQHPATTDELDALEQDHADRPAEAEVVGDS